MTNIAWTHDRLSLKADSDTITVNLNNCTIGFNLNQEELAAARDALKFVRQTKPSDEDLDGMIEVLGGGVPE